MPWEESSHSELTRQIRSAASRRELRATLAEAFNQQRELTGGGFKYAPFVRRYARAIYRVLLTAAEKAEVRAELLAMQRSFALYQPEPEEVEEAGVHGSDLHYPSASCKECYADLILSILERREDRHVG